MGRGCDTAILDDPISANQAWSDAERTHVNNWLDATLHSRLNNPATGAECISNHATTSRVGSHWVLVAAGTEQWMPHVCIPLVAEAEKTWVFPISGGTSSSPCRKCPHAGTLHSSRSRGTATTADGLLGPVSAECSSRWLEPLTVAKYNITVGICPRTGQPDERCQKSLDRKIISVDCGCKDSPTSDFVAICVIGVRGRKQFILNVVNARLDAPATEAAIRRAREMFSPINAVLVEDKANGPAIIQQLKINVTSRASLRSIPKVGKMRVCRLSQGSGKRETGSWIAMPRGLSLSSNRSPCSRMQRMTTWQMPCRRPHPVT